MTDSEHTFNQTKGESTRTNALEKEVARLKTLSQKQSVKHNKLKKRAFFQLLFFVVLLVMMFAYGIIQWPLKQDTTINTIASVAVTDTSAADTAKNHLQINASGPEIQGEDMLSFYVPEDGLLFSVQIGAYTGVDMRPFETNMFSLKQYTYQTINQFTVGIFQNFRDAEAFRTIIQQMGFHDAFIIATLNGKRLPIQDALSIKSRQQPLSESMVPKNTYSAPDTLEIADELLP